MNDILQKFSYIVSKMLEEYAISTWKSIEIVKNWENDLSILKIQKLLFFICTCNFALLGTFKFNALPYWPVNLETYKWYKDIENLNISKKNTINNQIIWFNDQDFMNQVEVWIRNLKNHNPYIFKYDAFSLVDISHKWDCWIEKKDSLWEISEIDILFSLKSYI